MAKTAICPDCSGPMYKGCKFCNQCKQKGTRNSRYGKKISSSVQAGRLCAIRRYKLPVLCESCNVAPPLDRHHKDSNTQNNERSNIAFLCRKCHQKADGRYEFIKTILPSLGGKTGRQKSPSVVSRRRCCHSNPGGVYALSTVFRLSVV